MIVGQAPGLRLAPGQPPEKSRPRARCGAPLRPTLPILALLLTMATANAQTPAERAIGYLRREVQAWKTDNACFSCHNNGDGARALYRAVALGQNIPELSETTKWLTQPAAWDNNRGDPRFSDKKLARIQFAAALTSAFEAGITQDRSALNAAAESLLQDQDAAGAWRVETGSDAGSPVTYGASLATWMAVRTLRAAGSQPAARERAEAWLAAAPVRNVPEAAAAIMATGREDAADWLARAQASDGGWGPYPGSPPEPFDTALAVLALSRLPATAQRKRLLTDGRTYLLKTQLPSGGWPETTRPPGADSYAQHISTTAWAAMALNP